MTRFKILIAHCGLSQREAAEYLGTKPDRIDNMCRGRSTAGDDYMERLFNLADNIRERADLILAKSLADNVDAIALTVPDEAQAMAEGLPLGAWAAMAGMVMTEADLPVVIAGPAGSAPVVARKRRF